MTNKTLLAVLLLMGISFYGASADTETPPPKAEAAAPAPAPAAPHQFVTHHKIQIGAVTLAYTADAGEIVLPDAEGAPKASIFSVSYVKEGSDSANRPITFLFNGGPGSSAVWLHLGAFGPKR